MTLTVLLHDITGANEAETAFIRESVTLLREAVAMPGFGASIRKADYGGSLWQGMHGKIRALSGDEIWERVHDGREAGTTGDHALNLSIDVADLPGPETANGARPIIGSTQAGQLPIRSARWFVQACMLADDPVNMAAHLMHQWMHVSGFVHGPDGHDSLDAPAVVARLVRRALEYHHGNRINAEITAALIGGDTGCYATTSANLL
ncbi:hypothetical protein RM533_02505 [Croceicoccus sp. F390]|uniref:Uncharacterized protein n=1 Tax=Croceicoccus esteveae TaxID=3075597 RepID=A0ABU2ZEM6_9SPHN|nr:hypothetical protein [Croceicoccus sp. F390]MDT0575053.1 hypothetical protein [Croceicoccus sp. F390]